MVIRIWFLEGKINSWVNNPLYRVQLEKVTVILVGNCSGPHFEISIFFSFGGCVTSDNQ